MIYLSLDNEHCRLNVTEKAPARRGLSGITSIYYRHDIHICLKDQIE